MAYRYQNSGFFIMAKKVLVIGAGISGLSAAWGLKKGGCDVKIIELKNRAGGVINTLSESGFRAESGSNSVMIQSQKTLDFIREIGLEGRLVHSSDVSKKRFFARGGRICEVPMSPLKMLFSRLFSLRGKIGFLKDFRAPKHDADSDPSVAQFTIDRLGVEALDYGMNPFMAGIYGGSPEKLSIKYAFPPFWNLEQKYGSIIRGAMQSMKEKRAAGNFFKPIMISFKDGLAELVERLADELKGNLTVGAKIVSIDYDMGSWRVCWVCEYGEDCDQFDEVVFAVPAKDLKNLPIPGSLASKMEFLDGIVYAPVISFTMGFRRSEISHKLDGFGALLPEKERQFSILGALFVSSVFEGRAPDGCATLTCYMGGMRHPEFFELEDEKLEEIALSDLQRLLGLDKSAKPMFKRIFRWKNAIAQYNVGYADVLEQLGELEREFPTVHMLGAYRGGVGVSSCIENGLELAKKISR